MNRASDPDSSFGDARPVKPDDRFEAGDMPIDFDHPDVYLNRETTWLEFNRRVLAEACHEKNPPLERLRFFSIFSSNLDEFFMKRIGGLKLQVAANVSNLTVDGRTPQQQIDECCETVQSIESCRDQQLPILLKVLSEHNIHILDYQNLTKEQTAYLRNHYFENIFPLITPQIFDPAHPFPFISNLSLNILVTLPSYSSKEVSLARVKVPVGVGVPRFIQLEDHNHYVPLEQLIANNLDLLFPGVNDIDYDFFFVARNASSEREESGANDLLSMIELELRDRRIAPIVRMVVSTGMDRKRRTMLAAQLGLDENRDVFETDTMMAQRDLVQLASLRVPELRYPSHNPVNHHRLQDHQRSIFHIIRDAKSILLQHPYESFATSVVRFLDEAAHDNKVRAIKMTLYRTDKGTPIVDLLINAARNGKQVAVVVELKAKFDEAANIQWAERMEEAGVHVTYGVVGLKTHCKVIMVVRQDHNGLRRYIHIGTGNYHGGTAKLYTDLGLLTCEEDIGRDVTELFNFLTTGYAPKRNYRSILPAPKILKEALISRIDREVNHHRSGRPSGIQIKTNALEDKDVVKALYQASIAGVTIELIVRDTCRLRPGVPGLSENISVTSIVGRFLEHSRVYYFCNGGEEEYLIGSADLMKRNLESRVEVVIPVINGVLKNELRILLNSLLDDDCDAWEMHHDGSYQRRQPLTDAPTSSQAKQIGFAQARLQKEQYKALLNATKE